LFDWFLPGFLLAFFALLSMSLSSLALFACCFLCWLPLIEKNRFLEVPKNFRVFGSPG